MAMDESTLALAAARGRMGFGIWATVTPGLMVRAMTGRKPLGAEAVFVRLFGARDLALGLGTVIALDHGSPVRGWLEAAALADAADAVSCVLGAKTLTPNAFKGTLRIAGLSAVVHVVLSRRLDPAPPAHPGQPEAIVTGHHEPAPSS
jgi:hypothetical protein